MFADHFLFHGFTSMTNSFYSNVGQNDGWATSRVEMYHQLIGQNANTKVVFSS